MSKLTQHIFRAQKDNGIIEDKLIQSLEVDNISD